MCGGRLLKLRKEQAVRCKKCSLTLDRKLCGAINIYLRMRGFLPPSTFYRAVIKPQMNPRGGLSLMDPKAYMGSPIPM